MSFCDWDKQKEGEYKLMAVAGRPRLIIKERVFGEEGKEIEYRKRRYRGIDKK